MLRTRNEDSGQHGPNPIVCLEPAHRFCLCDRTEATTRPSPLAGHDKMPKPMELYQLRSFAAIAETGQLTRAAEKLHVSQPALSAQLKALEEELEFALFERTSSGMTLTPAGKRLLEA